MPFRHRPSAPPTAPSLALALALLLIGPALAAQDPAQTPVSHLFGEGDVLPGVGLTVGGVPDAIHYVPGGFAVRTGVIAPAEVIESSTGAWLKTGQVLADGRSIGNLYNAFDVDGAGRLVAVARLLDEEGFDNGTAVLVDGVPVLEFGDLALPGLAPGRRWTEFDLSSFTASDRLLVAGFTAIPSTSGSLEYLAMTYDVAGDGSLSGAEIVLRTGDEIEGRYVTYVNAVYDSQLAVAGDGTRLFSVGLSATPGGAWLPFLIHGDSIVLGPGEPSVVPGYDWLVGPGEAVQLNEAGDIAFHTSIWNGSSGEDVLISNGVPLAVTGQNAPGVPGSELLVVLGPQLAEDGRVFWFGSWRDAGGLFHAGLFVDRQLWVEQGVTTIDGLLDATLVNILWQLDISADGSRVLFPAYHPGDDWHIYEARLDQWVDLGGGLAGSGPAPVASGLGVLEAGAPVSLGLTAAPLGSSAWLVVGLTLLGAPFKGGTLCPNPDLVLSGLPVDGTGALSVSGSWPAGIPAGTDLWWQFWTADPGAPAGFVASNCLAVQTP